MPLVYKQWISYRVSRIRNYGEEKVGLPATEASGSHPLAKGRSNVPQAVVKHAPALFDDPLSGALEGTDPLSLFAARNDETDMVIPVPQGNQLGDGEASQEWLKHRNGILSRFTTTEKLSITSSFLQGGEKCNVSTPATELLCLL